MNHSARRFSPLRCEKNLHQRHLLLRSSQVFKSLFPEDATVSCELVAANNLPVPEEELEPGSYLFTLTCVREVGENITVAYGETFDPCGSCVTGGVDAYNCCMNAPWAEWRSDKLEAGHLIEDMFDDRASVGKTVGEGKGKWR